jgi:hypothetical protein
MQVDLEAVKTSINKWTRSLKDDIMDTKKGFLKAIVNMKNNLHKELSLMFQVEAQTTKAEIRTNKERMEAKFEASQCEF